MFREFLFSEEDLIDNNLSQEGHSCISCKLYKKVRSPRMEAFGHFEKKILNIGEAPGEQEDKKGKQWQGKTGQYLKQTYEKLGIDLFKDCLNINAVNCRPTDQRGNNRTPTNTEIVCCRQRVFDVISQYKPKIIITLGNQGIVSLLGHRWKEKGSSKDLGSISRWRGWRIPDRELHTWVCPTFHPSFVNRSGSRETRTIWTQDLKRAFNLVDKVFPSFPDEKSQIEIVTSNKQLENLLGQVKDLAAFDYETTGKKPHAQGHRIVCTSVALDQNRTFVFMMPKTRVEREPFRKFLANSTIRKIAHNMKFEELWSVVRMKQPVQGWYWDSMLAAHILDNRSRVTGLKFQVYVQFGVMGYDNDVAPFLETGDKNSNSFNKIMKLTNSFVGREKLLTYCGLDSLFEFKLALKQIEEIKWKAF